MHTHTVAQVWVSIHPIVIFMFHAHCERCFWSLRLLPSRHLLPHNLSYHLAVPAARRLHLPKCRGKIRCVLLLRTLAPWPRTTPPQNQQSVNLPQVGREPELFRLGAHSMPKTAPPSAAAPGTPPASISEALRFQRLLWTIGGDSPWLRRTQRGKPRQVLLTNGLKQHSLEVGKLASTAKSLILRNIQELQCCGLVKLRMLRVLTISLLQHP